MAWLLDTQVICEWRKGDRANARVQAWFAMAVDAELYTSVLVVGEIRRGIEQTGRRDPAAAQALGQWLRQLEIHFSTRILPVTLEISERWGRMATPPAPAGWPSVPSAPRFPGSPAGSGWKNGSPAGAATGQALARRRDRAAPSARYHGGFRPRPGRWCRARRRPPWQTTPGPAHWRGLPCAIRRSPGCREARPSFEARPRGTAG